MPHTETATFPAATKPTAAPAANITFGEVASLLGIAQNILTTWAQRGLLPSPQEQTGHPHHWRWERDAMVRWIDATKSELAKAQESRL